MRILVTNDDGVGSPGLHALVRAVADRGHEVTVVAPASDMSGAGASIGKLHLDKHVDAKEVDLPGVKDVPAYAVDGPPGLCVMAARLGGFGEPPELVVSGINPGCNTGRAVLHSGTVGAALTGANFGLKGLAVSIDAEEAPDLPPDGSSDGRFNRHWVSAATVAASAVAWLEEAPDRTVLNINVPNRALVDIAGARWGELAAFGTVRTAVSEPPARAGGRLQMEFRPTRTDLPPGSDTALVRAGYVAITSITGIRATEPVDVDAIVGTVLMEGRRSA